MYKQFLICSRNALALLALAFCLSPAGAYGAGETIKQQVGLPGYFVANLPSQTGSLWDTVASSANANFGFVIANILNGPDYVLNPNTYNYSGAFSAAHTAGVKVIGYVDTGYFGRTGQKTRLGSSTVEAWRAQIQSDIDGWYNFYGASVDGIFFDQMDNECGTGNENAKRYEQVRGYVENAHAGALTVANPGIGVPQCFQEAADTIVTFEGTYACYKQDVSCPVALRFNALTWDHKDPKKIMHLVYDTSSANMADAVATTKTRKAGYVYITEDNGANPWDTIASYFSTELAAMPAGGTADTTAPTTINSLDTVDAFFTSVTLDWTRATDSGSGVIAYDLYNNTTGKLLKSVASTTATTQTTSIDGLTPNTAYNIIVKARDGSGNVSAASNVLSFTTDVDNNTNLYTAPGQPTSSAITYTSVNLTWAHSTGGEYARDYYLVYKDGVVIQKVPATLNSAQIVTLSPSSTYAFTVRVVDVSGNVSPLSVARSVTTSTLPGGASIVNIVAQKVGTNVVFTADFLYPWSFRRIYIDVDNNVSTGHTPYFNTALGADYMIENGSLLKSNTNGIGFNFSPVGAIAPTVTNFTYSWTVPLSTFVGAGATIKTIFQAEGFAPATFSAITTVL